MNKNEFIDAVAKSADLTKKDSERAVNAIIDVIKDSLRDGDEIRIMGFGTFEVSQRNAKQGRNPRTGEKIDIKASKAPRFRPGKALKDAVN